MHVTLNKTEYLHGMAGHTQIVIDLNYQIYIP